MLRKVLYAIPLLIQIILISGIFILRDLYIKRMGVMRHILFTNRVWEESYPITTIKTVVTVSFILLIIICIVFTIKKLIRQQLYSFQTLFLPFLFILLAGITVWIITFSSVDSAPTHYYDSLFLFTASVIQFITFFIYLIFHKDARNSEIRI